jgi:hypothetical protein
MLSVLHVTTWGVMCGIADYAEAIVSSLSGLRGVTNEVFKIDPSVLRALDDEAVVAHYKGVLEKALLVDVVHIQHEFSFFRGLGSEIVGIYCFKGLLESLLAMGKQVVVTFHSILP